MFYERRAMTKLQLYFIDILDYGKRRVMACGACGELYATDELGEDLGLARAALRRRVPAKLDATFMRGRGRGRGRGCGLGARGLRWAREREADESDPQHARPSAISHASAPRRRRRGSERASRAILA